MLKVLIVDILMASLKPSIPYCRDGGGVSRAPQILPPRYQETRVSRTIARHIVEEIPVSSMLSIELRN